jgi:hypothetical protein
MDADPEGEMVARIRSPDVEAGWIGEDRLVAAER